MLLCIQFRKIVSNIERASSSGVRIYVEKEENIRVAIHQCENHIYREHHFGIGAARCNHPDIVFRQRIVELREREHEFQRDA